VNKQTTKRTAYWHSEQFERLSADSQITSIHREKMKWFYISITLSVLFNLLLWCIDNWGYEDGIIANASGYFWLPGLFFSAFFYPAGIHDGVEFIFLGIFFNVTIYAIIFYAILIRFNHSCKIKLNHL
jgi:hypothetical protein